MQKVDHVRKAIKAGDVGKHGCHWPGCKKLVVPAVWGCKPHWMRLPLFLRNQIWATYRAGQEISKTPSRDYISVAHKVQDWIEKNTSPLERGMEYDL